MTPRLLVDNAIFPALRLLPVEMGSPAAMAMLVSIALQESRAMHRHQIGGPAHGYWQFEQGGGVRGVLHHPASKLPIRSVLKSLDYDTVDEQTCYAAIEHNDILAASFARLLLWTLPQAMPPIEAPQVGWQAYLQAWRPGKPHRDTWDAFYDEAWGVVIDATKDL